MRHRYHGNDDDKAQVLFSDQIKSPRRPICSSPSHPLFPSPSPCASCCFACCFNVLSLPTVFLSASRRIHYRAHRNPPLTATTPFNSINNEGHILFDHRPSRPHARLDGGRFAPRGLRQTSSPCPQVFVLFILRSRFCCRGNEQGLWWPTRSRLRGGCQPSCCQACSGRAQAQEVHLLLPYQRRLQDHFQDLHRLEHWQEREFSSMFLQATDVDFR